MKQLYYLLLILCVLTVNSCKKKNNTDNEGESDKGKIVGKVTLPTGAPINVNTLRILSPIEEVQISNGEYAIDTFARKFSTTLIINSNNDIVMMGYNYPGQQNHDVTPQSTALAMFMNAPTLQSLSEDARLQTIKKTVELPQFASFVVEVAKCISSGKKLLQSDSSNLPLAQAYVALFEKVATLRLNSESRLKPIVVTVEDKTIVMVNNKVSHNYVAGIYKDGVLQGKRLVINGKQMFVTSLKNAIDGFVSDTYGVPDKKTFTMTGNGQYEVKIRSGHPNNNDGSYESEQAYWENVAGFILQIFIDNLPMPNECLTTLKDKIYNAVKSTTTLPTGSSLGDFGNMVLEIGYNFANSTNGLFAECTTFPEGAKATKYIGIFSSIFKWVDFIGKVGTLMNVPVHIFDLYYSKAAIDTCFGLNGNTVSTCKYPSSMSIIDGNNQSGEANTSLAKSLIVEVRDDQGKLMEGVNVAWSVFQGGGLVTNAFSNTTTNGQATNTWKLGASGTQTVYAKVLRSDGSDIFGSPAVFSATVIDSIELYKADMVGNWIVETHNNINTAGWDITVKQYKTLDATGKVFVYQEQYYYAPPSPNPPMTVYNPPRLQENWTIVRKPSGYHLKIISMYGGETLKPLTYPIGSFWFGYPPTAGGGGIYYTR